MLDEGILEAYPSAEVHGTLGDWVARGWDPLQKALSKADRLALRIATFGGNSTFPLPKTGHQFPVREPNHKNDILRCRGPIKHWDLGVHPTSPLILPYRSNSQGGEKSRLSTSHCPQWQTTSQK